MRKKNQRDECPTVTCASFSILAYCFIIDHVIQIHHMQMQAMKMRQGKNNKEKNLEENSLPMPTESTSDGLGSRKSWVRSYILQDLCSFSSSVVHLVPIHTVIVRDLLNKTRISNVILNL
jgi:hypothetical protein